MLTLVKSQKKLNIMRSISGGEKYSINYPLYLLPVTYIDSLEKNC